jgi:chorismate mutase
MTETDRTTADLTSLRDEIERLDRELVTLIARRVFLARAVGVAKRAVGMATLDPAREAAIIRRAGELARDAGLGEEDVREIFWHVVGLCRRAQLEPLQRDGRD